MENFVIRISVEKPNGNFTFFERCDIYDGSVYCTNMVNRLLSTYRNLFTGALEPEISTCNISVDDALFVLFVAKIKALTFKDLLDFFENDKSIIELEKLSEVDYVQYTFKVLEHNEED